MPGTTRGTGHSAFCELNYTPQRPDGSIDISKADHIAEQFELSKQFWAYLVQSGALPDPTQFIHSIPHMSFVWGRGQRGLPPQAPRRYAALAAVPGHGVQRRPGPARGLDAARDGRARPGPAGGRHAHGHWHRRKLRGPSPAACSPTCKRCRGSRSGWARKSRIFGTKTTAFGASSSATGTAAANTLPGRASCSSGPGAAHSRCLKRPTFPKPAASAVSP